MKHVGDITKLNGAALEPVDCIVGGSPCQDLSVAGLRKGLAGERSGMFMEQVRIMEEARQAAHERSVKPVRYLVWENVCGAFSSNFRNGFGDFGAVLEEICRVAEPTFSLPRLEGKQKWTKAGCILLDGASVAWRVHDARYFVPQRRRRICIVADYDGYSAPAIVFERVGSAKLSDGIKAVGAHRPESSEKIPPVEDGAGGTGQTGREVREEPPGEDEEGYRASAYTLQIRGGCSGGGKGPLVQDELSATLSTSQTQTLFYAVQSAGFDGNMGAKAGNQVPVVVQEEPKWIIRRLMPIECERLQAYPDNWTDIGDWVDTKGKKHKTSDTPRYKALGNSICRPWWSWMFRRMADYLPEHAKLGSLFDGIGGFPLCWEEIHGKGTARWASEIEEFPIAVTKLRFPEEE